MIWKKCFEIFPVSYMYMYMYLHIHVKMYMIVHSNRAYTNRMPMNKLV